MVVSVRIKLQRDTARTAPFHRAVWGCPGSAKGVAETAAEADPTSLFLLGEVQCNLQGILALVQLEAIQALFCRLRKWCCSKVALGTHAVGAMG